MDNEKELGRIIATLENHSIILVEIKTKLDRVIDKNSTQDVDINRIGTKTDNLKVSFNEHKHEHWKVAGLVISVASFLSGFLAWLLNKK